MFLVITYTCLYLSLNILSAIDNVIVKRDKTTCSSILGRDWNCQGVESCKKYKIILIFNIIS